MADLGLADRIRAAGVDVVEVAGWQERGNAFDPLGFVWHHTAGGANGVAPSLSMCIFGSANSAPGPLCNVLQSREPDGNDKAYVIAAGKANHAGVGGWNGISGNHRVWGLEVEHVGTEPLPRNRQDIAIRIGAACLRGVGATDAANACQHSEWSWPPGSKIDIATDIDADDFRARCTAVLQGEDVTTPEQMATLGQWMQDMRNSILSVLTDTKPQDIPTSKGLLAAWENDTRDVVRDEVAKVLAELEAMKPGKG